MSMVMSPTYIGPSYGILSCLGLKFLRQFSGLDWGCAAAPGFGYIVIMGP